MNTSTQRLCTWLGLAFIPLFLIGFGAIAGFIPPPSPGDSAEQVARMFDADRDRIRIGMWITTGASALLACFFASITVQLRRIEGERAPLATTQAIAGACAVLEFIFPLLVWQTAAYRSGRSAESVQLLNDLAWLPFLGIISTYLVQVFAIAVVILRDKSASPVFPRWAAYLNIWAGFGVASGSLVVFTQTGPFAWNGILAFWLLVVAFFVWMAAMGALLLRAIRSEDLVAAAPG